MQGKHVCCHYGAGKWKRRFQVILIPLIGRNNLQGQATYSLVGTNYDDIFRQRDARNTKSKRENQTMFLPKKSVLILQTTTIPLPFSIRMHIHNNGYYTVIHCTSSRTSWVSHDKNKYFHEIIKYLWHVYVYFKQFRSHWQVKLPACWCRVYIYILRWTLTLCSSSNTIHLQ